MASIALYTYADLVDHLIDYLGANPSAEAKRDCRRAAQHGMRELASAHNWCYYYQVGVVNLVAPQDDGTVEYDHEGGSYERVVTLTGDTWPDWSPFATLRLGDVAYEVASRKSDTEITLSVNSNPGADAASGSSYTLYRDTYPLPVDCAAVGQAQLSGYASGLTFEHPGPWLERQRVYRGQATPRTYTVTGDPNFLGALAMRFFPAPDDAYEVRFLYRRRPRPLLLERYEAGRVTAVEGTAAVTGAGTAWPSRLAGCAFSPSRTTDAPTSPWGGNPPAYVRVVSSVNSATSITLDDGADEGVTNAKYVISDPLDVEDGAMLTALLRACEYQLACSRNKRDRAQADSEYQRALILAREADSRNFRDESAGLRTSWPNRLADFPSGPDA